MNRFYNYQPYLISPQSFFKLPTDVIGDTLGKLQVTSDRNKEMLGEIPSLFSVPTLDADKPLLRSIEQNFGKDIEAITSKANGDYSTIGNDMWELKKKLKAEMRPTGRIGAMTQNYGLYQENLKSLKQKYEKGEITSEDFSKGLNYALKQYEGIGDIDPVTGTYKTYNSMYVPTFDLSKKLEFLKEMKPEKLKESGIERMNGFWYIKTTQGLERLTPERLYQAGLSNIINDNDFKAYGSFRSKVDEDRGKEWLSSVYQALQSRANALSYKNKEIDRDMIYDKTNDWRLDAERNQIARRNSEINAARLALSQRQYDDQVNAFEANTPITPLDQNGVSLDANKVKDLWNFQPEVPINPYRGETTRGYGGISYPNPETERLANEWDKANSGASTKANNTYQTALKTADNKLRQDLLREASQGDFTRWDKEAMQRYQNAGDANAKEQAAYFAKDKLLQNPAHAKQFKGEVNKFYDNASRPREQAVATRLSMKAQAEQLRVAQTSKLFKISDNKITETEVNPSDLFKGNDKDLLKLVKSGEATVQMYHGGGATGSIVTYKGKDYFMPDRLGSTAQHGFFAETDAQYKSMAGITPTTPVNITEDKIIGNGMIIPKGSKIRSDYNTTGYPFQIGDETVLPGQKYNIIEGPDGRTINIPTNFFYKEGNPLYRATIQDLPIRKVYDEKLISGLDINFD